MRGAYTTEFATLDPDNDLFSPDADRNRSQTNFCCGHKYCDRTPTDRAGINSCIDTDRTGSYKNTYPSTHKNSRGLAKFRLPNGKDQF